MLRSLTWFSNTTVHDMAIETVLGEVLVIVGVLGAARLLEQTSDSSQPVAIPVPVKNSENSKKS